MSVQGWVTGEYQRLPGPLRHFAARLDELRSAGVPDMEQVGRVLAELAATWSSSAR